MRRWREVKEAGRRSRQKFGPPPPFNSNLSIQINSFIEEKERRDRGKWFIYPTIAAVVGGVDSSGAHSTTSERSDTDCIIIWIGATGAFACALIRLLD